MGRNEHTAHPTSNPFSIACKYGQVANVSSFIDAGQDVDARGTSGLTPLMVASGFGQLGVVLCLLAAGADVNLVCGVHTALYLTRHAGIAKALLATDTFDVKVNYLALHAACHIGAFEVFEVLVKDGRFAVDRVSMSPEPHMQIYSAAPQHTQWDSNGFTPLHAACMSYPYQCDEMGRRSIVQHLLARRDVDVNANKNNAVTPLFIACGDGNMDAVRLLLANDRVDPSAHYNRAVKHAISRSNFLTALLLLEDGRASISDSVYHRFLLTVYVHTGWSFDMIIATIFVGLFCAGGVLRIGVLVTNQ